jgi:RNA polymerase sigma factor (sigma-70 family)
VLANDNELLGKYLFGDDPQAFEELVRRHSGLVMGVCRNMLLHAHDAEDAFQGTFLILSKKAKTLINHGSIAGWLYQVAMRNCLQIRRRKGRARETEMIEEPVVGNNEPWLTISQAQESDLIYQEIDQLPKRYRDVIVLCHLQGHSRSEAAEFLDWTETAVKAALARGRNLLRRRLIRSGLLTSALLLTLQNSTATAQEFVSESLIDATLQNCQGLTPTVSVGTNPQFVQSLANQGVMSMQATTLIKSFVLTVGLAMAAVIPLAVIAQQIKTDREPDPVFVSADAIDNSAEVGVAVKVSESQDETVDNKSASDDLDDTFYGFDQYTVSNSEEYWKLMMESFRLRARALQEKSQIDSVSKGEQMLLMAESFEMEAKVVEAELNLQRIKHEKAQYPKIRRAKPKKGLGLAVGSATYPARPGGSGSNVVRPASGREIPPPSFEPVLAGEVLLIEVLDDQSLSRRVVVQADHTVSLPLAGTVTVAGLNPKEIGFRVQEELSKFMKEPQVFVCRESASTPLQSSGR